MVTSAPPVSDDEKRACLEAALNSATFARSAQLRALLRYICEREMAGRAEDLTEYQIAVDVLGRRKDVDFGDDASVRNRAYELRQRLERYYNTEQPNAGIRIEIPRGGYVPFYTRPPAAPAVAEPRADPPARRRMPWIRLGLALATIAVVATSALLVWPSPHPPSILKEAWGPLADPSGDLLVVIATNMHMLVRPHIAAHAKRLPAPDEVYPMYSPRPLAPGTPLYMEPATLSVPLAELAAAATFTNLRTAFGGTYQILPESEAPVAALRGRNGVLIGSGTNSQAATVLLRNLPFTIDYNGSDQFAVFDQRKPAGANQIFVSQPSGEPVPSTAYGLLTVITSTDLAGKAKRTLVLSGSASPGVQAAAEFFCSPWRMSGIKDRFQAAGIKGFPPTYQVVVRCKTSGVRLISYEYASHAVPERN
ncbi:MAG TPA: hypothetical protein VKB88_00370 [Bryobacteraceae bacterium]|nr:hypothetical protein [Bryobacteraceae bacterium]